MFIVRHRKIFFILTTLLVIFSVGSMIVRGFNFGIDFTGGSILEVSYDGARPNQDEVKEKLNALSIGEYSLRPTGEHGYVLRTKELTLPEKNKALAALSLNSASTASTTATTTKVSTAKAGVSATKTPTPVATSTVMSAAKEDRFNTIGPVVGSELRSKAYVAIAVTILGIVLFVTFAFRKVSKPVQSWKYGLATIVALVHDVVIAAGVYIFITYFTGAELDLLFMTALLAILGYSVHDTIVVFDRVRENLHLNNETRNREEFENVVGRSVSQTMGRSINTSLTIIIVLIALYFVGGDTTRNFSLLLTLGVLVGTYSSICIASPLLVVFEKFKRKA